MKILIDARMYGLENSGIGRYIINLIENLKEIDHQNNYVVLLKKDYFDQLNFPNNWKKVQADIHYYSFEEQIQLPKLLNDEKPDLVHFPHINVPIFYRGNFVVTAHDMTMHSQGTEATTLPRYKYLFKRVPYKLVFRNAIINSKVILTPSRTVKDEIVEYFKIDPTKVVMTYEGSSRVLKSGEDNVLSNFGLKTGEYFFYVGNAYPHKNLDLVINAIKGINKEGDSKVIFAIAGSKNVFIERLQTLIDKEKAQGYVKILGYVPDENLQTFYKNSIAFVYPSLSEGFGLQGLEAMAFGALVLASEIPVFREIYKDNVLYFDPKSVESLIKVMKTVMKMSIEEKKAIVINAKAFIKRYSWKKMARETLNVYKGVLNV
ncbi:hypothetical protein A2714_04495 [Candidatus Woesebacteria bacterium RIFCSPHIGHO2_01_FULL_38_9]|uniref:Glycosyl transferase family 1 domain-containing protein n=2 Tax=Candidatus Woeseibacteriota TaxID=1752722 RepID=A0A1F7XZV3_9BACT|nr:MAG: hypothetical protein A2714_04495 [Candidatus Woesebacteria bacterium RIFCSPHIGHO2_01_FULL_38_9]OGM58342.1 MAG: hypothetical protein A3A75_04915 [Candidatus Woesebacteria bacterium RIFCSPLOWO2_01_FULL_39_10]